MNDNIYRLLNGAQNEEFPDPEPLSKEEVTSIMKRFENENNRTAKPVSHKKRRIIAAVTAIAAAAVFVPTSVFAYSRISARIEKTANYRNTITIPAPTEPENLSENALPYMMFSLDYVPEGFVFGAEGTSHAGKYHNEETGGGMSAVFYRIPADGKDFQIDLTGSESCENYETEGKTAMISYRVGYSTYDGTGNPYGREVWISFNDTRYLLQLFVTNDISQEELYKIIDNVSLYETDEKRFGEYFPWLDKSSQSSSYENPYLHPVDIADVNMKKLGESADYDDYSFTVNSVVLTDSFDGIYTDSCGWTEDHPHFEDFRKFMDENGNILPNTRTWYSVGDDINTIDEAVLSYDMPYHILKLSITVTNTTDEFQEIGISPQLIGFNSEGIPGGEEDLNRPEGYENLYYTDFIQYDVGGFFSFSADAEHKGDKNSLKLAAGESADIQICFACSENRVGNLYLYFGSIGNSYSQSLKSGNPLVDLCDLRPE